MLDDRIGRDEIINKICKLIDNLPKNDKFTLALNGSWGSGKTFIIDKIEEKLQLKAEYLIVKYDAWKNNFYSDPLIAILYCIYDSLQNCLEQVSKQKIIKVSVQSGKKHLVEKAEKSFEKYLKKMQSLGGWCAVVSNVICVIKSIIKQVKTTNIDSKMFDDFKSYQSLLSESIEALNRLTIEKTEDGKQRRIIILVDEIDRCLPDMQILILERLHHLFQVKNCALIIALNKTCLTTTFNYTYGNSESAYPTSGALYLKKFFDYNFNIKCNYETFLKNSINSLLDQINQHQSSTDYLIEKTDMVYIGKYLCKLCHNVNHFDNREVVRLINLANLVIREFVNNNHLNNLYLWFIFTMIYEKIYGSNFNSYKQGACANPIDVMEIEYHEKIFTKENNKRIGNMYFSYYTEPIINQIAYMINDFASRNKSSLHEAVNSVYGFEARIQKAWDINQLEKIADLIDIYSS